jgi:hypothetical protein
MRGSPRLRDDDLALIAEPGHTQVGQAGEHDRGLGRDDQVPEIGTEISPLPGEWTGLSSRPAEGPNRLAVRRRQRRLAIHADAESARLRADAPHARLSPILRPDWLKSQPVKILASRRPSVYA